MKSFIKVLFSLLVVLTLSQINFPDFVTQFSVIVTALAVLTASLVPAKYLLNGSLNMAVNIEIWQKYVIEKLRKDNSFIFESTDDSGYVLGGAVVHISQAGNSPVVQKNRSVYPGVAIQRGDTDITYALDSYTTDPTHIPFIDLQTISYDKIDSVLRDHMLTIGETYGDDILIKWATNIATFINTTGGPTALTDAPVAGQTGTRKQLNSKDLIKAMVAMNLQNVPKKGRICLMDDNMYGGFYDSLTDTQNNTFNQFADNKTGLCGRLHGFDIYTRTAAVQFAAGNTVKALGAAIAATDNLASLCWHPSTVCRAIGETKPFQRQNDPLYYGDIYSMIMRMGGRIKRADGKGVVAIVQAP
jgi:hypothetical protein